MPDLVAFALLRNCYAAQFDSPINNAIFYDHPVKFFRTEYSPETVKSV
jgi:hypothetical protein